MTRYLSLAFLIALAACQNPSPMPSGYTYHHDLYKSAPPSPPSTEIISRDARRYMSVEQATEFRNAAYALLEKLTMRAGLPPKPVYVVTPAPLTNFYANIDNELRETMRQMGYTLADNPQGAYVMTYDAVKLPDAAPGQPNIALYVRIFNALMPTGRLLTTESGAFFIRGADILTIPRNRYAEMPTAESITPMTGVLQELERRTMQRTVYN